MTDSNRGQLRVLHTSDLHLDLLGDKGCDCLEVLIKLAIKEKVDLVVIAGDLFDHNRVDDDLISFAVGELERLTVPTVILPGNHDCLVLGSAFERAELWRDCANVRIIGMPQGEMLDLPELGVSLWGKSMDFDDGSVRPLAGIPRPQENGYWHIAVAHGYYVSSKLPLSPSYHITMEEIVTSGWDYIALGHIPVFRCICSEPVKAYYCGSPPLTGTVALVELAEETGVQISRCLL